MKLPKVNILVATLLVALGFYVGRDSAFRSLPASLGQNLKLESLKTQISDVYETDMQEYAKLKTMKAKYETANDILAKMMTIFLADFGLRISQKDIDKITQPLAADGSMDAIECRPTNARSKKGKLSCPSLYELAKEQGKELIPIGSNKKKKEPEWMRREKDLDKISTNEDVEKFLKDVAIENFFDAAKELHRPGKRVVDTLNGKFTGELNFIGDDRTVVDVELVLDAIMEDSFAKGHYEIKLSRNGETFSNSSGDGELKQFKEVPQSPNAIFIEVGGSPRYFQLYSVGGGQSLIGNYYEEVKMGSWEKKGTLQLYHR